MAETSTSAKGRGLSSKEAAKLLAEHGYNELEKKKKNKAIDVLARQVNNFIIFVLLAAALISLYVGEEVNFGVISAIIIFVIILGFVQEYRAEKAMEALKKIVQPVARVLREGKVTELPSRELVPGDVIILETGDKIPADASIFEIIGLRVDESTLTGESLPVEKSKGETIYAGTQIVHGRCKALVTATGMKTKLGTIASLIQEEEAETPLQKKISHLTKNLAIVALAACALTLALGLFKGAPLAGILIISLALAVAAVPEGLALTLTLTLAYGMQRMANQKAIIRKMLAVETLGSVTVICTDKTGTLTENKMTVEKIYADSKVFEVTGTGFHPAGDFLLENKKVKISNYSSLNSLLTGAALCTNAILKESSGKWEVLGDPTEGALVVAAAKADLWKDDLEDRYNRVQEAVFTSERKLMTTVHSAGSEKIAFTKGAPENVLEKCSYIEKNGKMEKLGKEEIARILKVNKSFSEAAFRSLAVAYKKVKTNAKIEENEMIFLGLIALRDPPRREVKEAITLCNQAGIKVLMITGDNEETAKAIGKNIGLIDGNESKKFEFLKDKKLRRIVEDGAITGSELNELSDKEFETIVDSITIYARTLPEQKLRIVNALKKKKHIVAMTGDGVNDAPALKKADIGIAMGVNGTDVAKEASSMVLQDDNFATIVEAVKEGRTIYENIEKFTTYLISRNFTEVILILLGITFLGFNFLPLLALQILFINTFDEIIPAISLGLDPPRRSVMTRKPRDPREQILKKRNLAIIGSVAGFIALASFLVFLSANPFADLAKARTLTFATIISMILFVPFAFRSLDESVAKTGISSNKLMVFGSLSTFLITLAAMYIPFFREIFSLTTLTATDWILPILTALIAMGFIELMKKLTKQLSTV